MSVQTPPKFKWPGKKGALMQTAYSLAELLFPQPVSAASPAPQRAPTPTPGLQKPTVAAHRTPSAKYFLV